nr:SMC-Scp complex subunit ScpB [candidate division Zixibacteria bacterium]
MLEMDIKLPLVESLILASPEPLPARKIADIVEDISSSDIEEIIDLLNRRYHENNMSFRIRRIAGGYQIYIVESFARHVEELLTRRRSIRMTRAALETLAIIAYRQPVTKMDIEMIRGVASDSVIHTLLERKLVTMAGRSEAVGRPLLYKTTDEFLKFFNLNAIDDLPKMQEIEELLASRDSDYQPSLPLDEPAAESDDEIPYQKTDDDNDDGIEDMTSEDETAEPEISLRDEFEEDDDLLETAKIKIVSPVAEAGEDDVMEDDLEEMESIENSGQ